jgi:carbonic anhydrase/acetyltransferase-like protein (isoleucine patch superfamily)
LRIISGSPLAQHFYEKERRTGLFLEHRGKVPRIHPSAYIAPTATICGDISIGANSRVLFGAVIVAEGGPVDIGSDCIIMEQAVIRGTAGFPTRLGNAVLVGPRSYLTGCMVENDVFLATGVTIFNGAHLGTRAEVRINGVVHIRTRLPAGALVPIGWVAVGDPAQILPPNEHDQIWAIQEPLNFPRTVFGLERAPEGKTIMPEMMARYARALGRHLQDRVLDVPNETDEGE